MARVSTDKARENARRNMANYYGRNRERWNAYMKQYSSDHYKLDTSIIYGVRSKRDKQICYVGESSYTLSNRVARHKHAAFTRGDKTKFACAMREYGMDNFEFFIIDDGSEGPFLLTESYYIALLNPEYNVNGGNRVRQVRNVVN